MMFKRKKAKTEKSRVSESASFNMYVSKWDFYSKI